MAPCFWHLRGFSTRRAKCGASYDGWISFKSRPEDIDFRSTVRRRSRASCPGPGLDRFVGRRLVCCAIPPLGRAMGCTISSQGPPAPLEATQCQTLAARVRATCPSRLFRCKGAGLGSDYGNLSVPARAAHLRGRRRTLGRQARGEQPSFAHPDVSQQQARTSGMPSRSPRLSGNRSGIRSAGGDPVAELQVCAVAAGLEPRPINSFIRAQPRIRPTSLTSRAR